MSDETLAPAPAKSEEKMGRGQANSKVAGPPDDLV